MKPTLIYDGECHFCRRWVNRWHYWTRDKVDYIPSDSALERFPDIDPERLKKSVVLREPEGGTYDGAEAVFRCLSFARHRSHWLWLYHHVPGFRFISENIYSLVASHRIFFSRLTKFLWGSNVEPSIYSISPWLFIRALALIYAIAFLSFWIQMPGLIGERGILPAQDYLKAAQVYYGEAAFWKLPTLGWLGAANASLHVICLGGVTASLLLFLGILPPLSCFVSWILYLSIVNLGQAFMSFQWDILMLESGLLALGIVSWHGIGRFKLGRMPSRLCIWLYQWLLFRLMFRSGIVKLASGDLTWKNLEALKVHYESQPLPTWIGWYAHQLPDLFHVISCLLVFFIELVLPFLIFLPRRLRTAACTGFIAFQVLIMLTGNYCFFNLLTIALCFFLIDDSQWPSVITKKIDAFTYRFSALKIRYIPGWILSPFLLVVIIVSSVSLAAPVGVKLPWANLSSTLKRVIQPFHVINAYGLFAVMTANRYEIFLEGSEDGKQWKVYDFKYKPGDLDERPVFVQPYQPRLDWQMWFAALGSFRANPWLLNLMVRILEGEPDVLALFEKIPFKANPPRFVRAVRYEYHFTDLKEKRQSGRWWQRSGRQAYSPVLMRKNGQIQIAL